MNSLVAEFECTKCKNTVSIEQFELSRFCPDCGTFLQPKRVRSTTIDNSSQNVIQEIRRGDVNLDTLFYEYTNHQPIDVGGGVRFRDAESWILARKRKYKEYIDKFSPNNLHDLKTVVKNYENWLLFRNNMSWTTLHRKGYLASNTPERLADLLFLLQDEFVDIKDRVYRGLKGKNKVYGIAEGILTALLHTFNCEKYGVWNSRTVDTLEILRRTPIRRSFHSTIGHRYEAVNEELHHLRKELNTDLTTIDGFMWYISKHIRFV